MVILYQGSNLPLKTVSLNYLEVFNETTIFLLSYLILTFSDYNLNPMAKKSMGVPYCALICLTIGVNLAYILYFAIIKRFRELTGMNKEVVKVEDLKMNRTRRNRRKKARKS